MWLRRRRTTVELGGHPDREHARQAAGVLPARFEALLLESIAPVLTGAGFTRSARTFRRRREPLYDVVQLQGTHYNGIGTFFRFYVNVGFGSREVDAAQNRTPRRPELDDCVRTDRWNRVVDDLPAEVEFYGDTDLEEFGDALAHAFARLVRQIDSVTTTDHLVDRAAERLSLSELQPISAYLAGCGEPHRLIDYVTRLRSRWGSDHRWPIFATQIVEAVGTRAAELRDAGVLG